MDRRAFISGTIGTLLLSRSAKAQTHAPMEDVSLVSELPPLPADLASHASQPAATIASEFVGTQPPSTDEIATAHEILLNSPYNVPAIEVAQYFLAVGAGAYGPMYRPYAREWPIRANPLIMHFFTATQTKPEGDTTAWCAAFVNWCLLRSHAALPEEVGSAPSTVPSPGFKPFPTNNLKSFSTNNAASGSFRCWEETPKPRRGDIVVFKNAGTDSLSKVCQGSGHVAFFLKIPAGGIVQVLGGNQSQAGSNGAVTVANMSTKAGSRFMKYVSLKGS